MIIRKQGKIFLVQVFGRQNACHSGQATFMKTWSLNIVFCAGSTRNQFILTL